MTVKEKYQPVLDMGVALDVKDGKVDVVDGKLKVYGVVQTQYEKNILWDKIKEIGGPKPADIGADIRVANKDYYHKHQVVSGDTLSGIAKTYYGKPNKYMHIFNANQDQLDNPDLIKVGQELIIPFADPNW